MRRYITYIAIFFLTVVLCDFGAGILFDRLHSNAKGGIYRQLNGLIDEDEYDVVVFGSSRACHHYIPSIIRDSLGLSCYNAGCDGMGILYSEGLLTMMLERYSPKMIILDCSIGFDVYKNPQDDENRQYLGFLKPYADRRCVKSVFCSVSYCEYLKSYSALYRYNSIAFDLVRENVAPSKVSIDGFKPLFEKMNIEKTKHVKMFSEIDTVKVASFERFIKLAKSHNVPIVVFFSPFYGIDCHPQDRAAIRICQRYDVPCYDCVWGSDLSMNSRYFADISHLNVEGAEIFSVVVSSIIKKDM